MVPLRPNSDYISILCCSSVPANMAHKELPRRRLPLLQVSNWACVGSKVVETFTHISCLWSRSGTRGTASLLPDCMVRLTLCLQKHHPPVLSIALYVHKS